MLAHMYSDNGFTEEVVFKSASMLYGNSKCNKAKCSTGERSRERSRAVNVTFRIPLSAAEYEEIGALAG